MSFQEKVNRVIQKQYATSNIGKLMMKKARIWDKFIGNISDKFVKEVLNIDTCSKDFLLYFWGYLFKLSQTIKLSDGTNITLSEEEFRTLLKIRAFGMNYTGTIEINNEFLKNVFSGITCYSLDPQNMQVMYYFFDRDLVTENIKKILNETDILPIPAGVGKKIKFLRKIKRFGFLNYNQIYVLPQITGLQTYTNRKQGKVLSYLDT